MVVAKRPNISGCILKVTTINDSASNNRCTRPLRKHLERFGKIRLVGMQFRNCAPKLHKIFDIRKRRHEKNAPEDAFFLL